MDFWNGEIVKAVQANVETTDATETTLAAITGFPSDCAGFLEVTLFALDTGGGKSITGKRFAHWKSVAGVPSVMNVISDSVDGKDNLTTATWTVDASGSDIRIRVTGEAATNLQWHCYYNLQYINVTPP